MKHSLKPPKSQLPPKYLLENSTYSQPPPLKKERLPHYINNKQTQLILHSQPHNILSVPPQKHQHKLTPYHKRKYYLMTNFIECPQKTKLETNIFLEKHIF